MAVLRCEVLLVVVFHRVVLVAVLRCVVLFNFVVHRMCLMVRTMQMLRRQVLRSCDASAKHHCDCGLIRKAVRPPSSRA